MPWVTAHESWTAEQLGRRIDRVAEPGPPRPAVALSEPELEQQHEVGVVGLEHAVVEGLAVVGVGAGFEQQAGEGAARAGGGAGRRSALPAAERAGERGERRGEPVPEVAAVGIGAGVEQQPGDAEDGGLVRGAVESGVGEVEQRRPTERPALSPGGAPVASEVRGDGRGSAAAAAAWMLAAGRSGWASSRARASAQRSGPSVS